MTAANYDFSYHGPGGEVVEDLVRRYEELKAARYNWDWHWREIAERIWPDADDFPNLRRWEGEKRNEKVYDATGAIALGRFAAVLEALLTPRSQTWHRLRSPHSELNEDVAIKRYFDELNRALFLQRSHPQANFYNQMYRGYMSLGAFGGHCLQVPVTPGSMLRYRNCHVGDVYIATNDVGIVDTIFYRYRLDAKEAYQAWQDKARAGVAQIPPSAVRDIHEKPHRKREYVHIVFPRNAYDVGRSERPDALPWESYHIDYEAKDLIESSGLEHMPYVYARYTVSSTETYGRGPAAFALPSIKMLQDMNQSYNEAAHLAVRPPLLAHKKVAGHGSRRPAIVPGKLTYNTIDESGKPLIAPLFVGAQLPEFHESIERERKVVNDVLLTTLFEVLVQDRTGMTATEVLVRLQEKGQLIAPLVGRQQSEALGPIIDLELASLHARGKAPEPPPQLIEAGGEYEAIYESPAQRMARAEEAAGALRTVESLMPYAQLNPDIMEKVNWEEFAEAQAEVNGMPAKQLRSKEEFAQVIQQREQQRQEQQRVDQLEQLGGVSRDLAGSVTEMAQ